MARVRAARAKSKTAAAAGAAAADRFGAPGYDRRLSDKILAAFNHAYASGARQTATRLKSLLAEVESAERANHERRRSSAVAQADLWVRFVEARDGYNALLDNKATTPAELEEAMERMKETYRAWSGAF